MMMKLISFALVLCACGQGLARSIEHDESIVAVVTGTLYALDGGAEYRLNRRHLSDMDESRAQAMRLDMGPEVDALEMELSQESAWTDDSKVVVRRGEQVKDVHGVLDKACFLSGHLTSHSGGVSLNRCGRMTGIIEAGDHSYQIEEADNGDNSNSELFNVKVTMRRSEDVNSGSESVGLRNDVYPAPKERVQELDEIIHARRQLQPMNVEVAIFIDANFIRYQAREKGRATTAQLTAWLVNKWNVIRGVFGNTTNAGVPLTVQLKKIELWRVNPAYYERLALPSLNTTSEEYLMTFCRRTSNNPDYDHKMLYTQGTGEHHMGMAYLNSICRDTRKCSFSKGKYEAVKIEVHEFGHNLGLPHDDTFDVPCTDVTGKGGFMGWGKNYDFMDCYRTTLRRTLRQPEARCLLENNVPNLPVLNGKSQSQQCA